MDSIAIHVGLRGIALKLASLVAYRLQGCRNGNQSQMHINYHLYRWTIVGSRATRLDMGILQAD